MAATQGNPPPRPVLPISSSSGHSELTAEGGLSLSQLEQTATLGHMSTKNRVISPISQGIAAVQPGPTNMLNPLEHHVIGYAATEGDGMLVSSGKSSKLGFRKRLSALFKGDSKDRDSATNTSPAQTPVRSGHCVHAADSDVKSLAIAMVPASFSRQVDAATTTVTSPIIQLQPIPTTPGSLHPDIFSKNIKPAVLTTSLPNPRARIEQTTQLVYCCQVLSKEPPLSADSDTDELQVTLLDTTQQEWVKLIDPVEQDHLHWIVEKLVQAFVEDDFKGSVSVVEIVLLGPILDRETYRTLLCCCISLFEQIKLLDVILLRGLIQLVECASAGYLVDDDLVRIAAVLFKELSITHIGTSDHVLLLTLALGRVLDVMVAGKVKNLNRDRDHQPMLQLLDGLRSKNNAYLKYQASYAYQALQYVPDDETPLQVVWRYSKVAASGASSAFKLDPAGLLKGIECIQGIGKGVADVVKSGFESNPTLCEAAGMEVRVSEKSIGSVKKQSWYLALQGTALFIHQGRLSDFKEVVSQAPCRHDANFQWGICRQIGEVAVDPLWDKEVRQQAIDFLSELHRSNTDWKPHVDVKRWIIAILHQISTLDDATIRDRARVVLYELKVDGSTEFSETFPLCARLPLPVSFPLLARVQEIPRVEYDLHRLRMQRIDEYKQVVYIAPLAKPSLYASDDSLLPLMDRAENFLTGDGQVMLVLGDSGAGKSTFNRYMEYLLWQLYKPGQPIPLFINLPAMERPEKELVAEQLQFHNFSEEQIRELKLHRQFLLICDGYDESQLLTNLYATNSFNQYGQWNVKLFISCRTQYLGPNYRDRFEPKSMGQHYSTSSDRFLEAVIAPFSEDQIELYVEKYVPLEPRTWMKKDYMDKLTIIPNLMDLVKNPFLLTLALEALPEVVKGKADLARLCVTRVELYDTFCMHWLRVNKRRLQELKLNDDKQLALEDLLNDGFEQNGIDFQKKLAAAIFKEQDGRPIVEYSHLRDKATWKMEFFSTDVYVTMLREASLLSRASNQHRFIHRSILEYFFSCAVWDSARDDDGFTPQGYSDAKDNVIYIKHHLLSIKNLVSELSIIQFLAERVRRQPDFKQHLLGLVELSKSYSQASQAAANAITVLVTAGVQFNGADLRGIRVPGADLTDGRFDAAHLQFSDLTSVNITNTWIRRADFSGALMVGVRFGELLYLEGDGSIRSCALSPNGKTFAAGLDEGDISIYDTVSWTKTQSFLGLDEPVSSLSFSPTGHHLLSGNNDGMMQLWNSETGMAELMLEGHTSGVKGVAYSPTGNQVASASNDKTVRLWDVKTGAVLFVLVDHSDEVNGVSFSPDGNAIVSCGGDGTVRTFSTRDGHLVRSSKKFDTVHCCVAHSADGQRIALGEDGGRIQLWRTETMVMEIEWEGHFQHVSSVRFSPDGRLLVSSSGDTMVKVWDAHTGALISAFQGHASEVTGVAIFPSTLQVVSTGSDATIRIWDMNLTGHSNEADDTSGATIIVVYSPDGERLISQAQARMLLRRDADTGLPDLELCLQESSFECAVYSPSGLQIASGDSKGDVTLWNAQSGVVERSLCGHSGYISALAYSPCGRSIASGSHDKTVRVWDICSGSSIYIFPSENGTGSLKFSSDGLGIIVGCAFGSVHIRTLSNGNRKDIIIGGGRLLKNRVVFPPGASHIASCDARGDEGIRLFDEEGKHCRTILKHDQFKVELFAYSSCGRLIAAFDGDKLHIWTNFSSNGTEPNWMHATTIDDYFADVRDISWRPKTTGFATVSRDGDFQEWNVIVVEDEESSKVSVQPLRGCGRSSGVAPVAVLVGTAGVGAINKKLLEQRGAIFESSSNWR